MSAEYVLKLDSEKIREMPMVDLAYELLKAANTPFYYRDLMKEIAKIRGLSEDQIMDVIAHLYTEINIDGRFACVGGNVWGLKRWYPVERTDDPMTGGVKRPRIINDDDDDLDDEDLYTDDEEDTSTPDDDSYDLFDEDTEEVFEEGEEAADTDDEALIEEDEESALDEDLDEEKNDGDDDFEDDDEDLEAVDDDKNER